MSYEAVRRCKDCAWLSKVVVDNFAYCHFHKQDVWVMSVGCNEWSNVGLL